MADMRLGIEVDTDTRATRREFSDMRQTIKREADAMGGDWEAAAAKVEDALREAGARDDLVDAARRIGEQGPTEIEKMRRALRELDDVDPEIDIEVDTEGPLTKTQDMMNEVKSTVSESMGELAGSFAENGFNMEDSIGGVVEVAAESAALLPGPWSLAGAALVAVSAGVYGEWKQRMEDIAEAAGAMYQDMLESGRDFLSDEYFQNALADFWDPLGDGYDENMKNIDLLADLGIPADEAALALVGYGETSDRVLAELERGHDKLHDDIRGNAGAYQDLGLTGEIQLDKVRKRIGDTRTSTDRAKDAVDRYRQSIGRIPDNKNTNINARDRGTISATERRLNQAARDRAAELRVYADTYPGEAAVEAFRARQESRRIAIEIVTYGQAKV